MSEMQNYFKIPGKLLGIYCSIQFLMRLYLLAISGKLVSSSTLDTIKTFGLGFLYDLVIGMFLLVPIIVFFLFTRGKARQLGRYVYGLLVIVFFWHDIFYFSM